MKAYSKEYEKEAFYQLKQNKKENFEQFYSAHYNLVYKIAFSILKNKENSEDITQNVFTKLYKIETEKLPTKNELSWLYSVVKNEAITYLRTTKISFCLDDIYDISSEDKDIEAIIEKDRYNRIIDKLNDKEKEIISLKIIGQMSFSQISKILNMPIGTVQWHYYKALNTLKIAISNISMCLIAFVLYLKTKNVDRSSNIMKNESIEIPTNQIIEEDTSTKDQEKQESLSNKNNIADNNTIQEAITIADSNSLTENNVISNGFLALSSIFLIVSITFLVIFVKYQQNGKNKSSK